MSPHLRLPIVIVALTLAGEASAQTPRLPYTPIALHASATAGRFQGTVQDESGSVVSGVSILAAGTTLALVRSDGRGRFQLELPVGRYLVRAERPGYVSTYRELVDVRPNGWVERVIRLTRAALPAVQPDSGAVAALPAGPLGTEPGRGEVAWRLRHLPRTVLRDFAPAGVFAATEAPRKPSLLRDQVPAMSGQVHLFATRSFGVPTGPSPVDASRGIADVIIGAPVGTTGDWMVRGAMLAGDASSWTLFGEYQARAEQRHGVRVAFLYSTQGFVAGRELPMSVVVPESRSAAGLRVSDRWRVGNALELDYGVRFDRYDYLAHPDLISPRAGVRARAFSRTFVVASTSQRMIAPGADEFLPPSASGPWLPPTRTFAALSQRRGLVPEQVRRQTAGFEQEIGARRTPFRIEWFSESTTNQIATLYGLDQASEVGHYYVATAGHVEVRGWRARFGGQLSNNVHATVEYANGEARWTGTRMAASLRRRAPLLARRGQNEISDFRVALDAVIPRTVTRVAFVYRLNSADQGPSRELRTPIGEGRFNLELSQRLPYQPLNTGILSALLTVRTLMHDDGSGSLYDEALTLRPPTRITGGVQVRF